MSQSGQAGSAGGGGVSSLVVDGDVGSASPSANILNMLATPTSGATVQFNASGNTVSFNVSETVLQNQIMGFASGNSSLTGTQNCAFGIDVLHSLTTGSLNVALGHNALVNATSGGENIGISGQDALFLLTTGTGNIAISGNGPLSAITTGIDNIQIGAGGGGGGQLTLNDSYNILIGNSGVTGNSNSIRIGSISGNQQDQTTCYLAGVNGNTPSNPMMVVIDSAASNVTGSGQLGTMAIPSATTLTITTVNHAASPYTVLSTDQFLACDPSAGAITLLLPDAPTTGRVIYIKDSTGNSTLNPISVTTVSGTDTFDGATTYIIGSNYQSINVIFDGSNYEVF